MFHVKYMGRLPITIVNVFIKCVYYKMMYEARTGSPKDIIKLELFENWEKIAKELEKQ